MTIRSEELAEDIKGPPGRGPKFVGGKGAVVGVGIEVGIRVVGERLVGGKGAVVGVGMAELEVGIRLVGEVGLAVGKRVGT